MISQKGRNYMHYIKLCYPCASNVFNRVNNTFVKYFRQRLSSFVNMDLYAAMTEPAATRGRVAV